MPWTIQNRKGKYYVVKESTGEAVDSGYEDRDDAIAHLGALYANVPEVHKKLKTINWEDREKACCSTCAKTGGSCETDGEHETTGAEVSAAISDYLKTTMKGKAAGHG